MVLCGGVVWYCVAGYYVVVLCVEFYDEVLCGGMSWYCAVVF